jgi:hypothetical protein
MIRALLILVVLTVAASSAQRPYVVVGTGQTHCYDDRGPITPPPAGQPYFGQDAQHPGPAASYRGNGDGTVSDLNTGLMWVKARGVKMPWPDAVAGAAKCRVGGYTDWRMPTIKELYSLINFNGGCSGQVASSVPYIDTRAFDWVYGDETQGYRIIDSQDWSGTVYLSTTMGGIRTAFGVNFADGRIKGYGMTHPNGFVVKMYARYVRGNAAYGQNDFHDNGDGTIADRATGLMWQQADAGQGLDWPHALAYAAASRVAGYSDWRLPNAKELESIVDYSRAPDVTHSPALSPLFKCAKAGADDYPWFWTSTTHLDGPPDRRGQAAVYVCFGRATGFMSFPPGSGNYQLLDVHGAGAQRSDPKVGDPRQFPYGRGPQGDVISIYNDVRLVRGPVE